MKLVAENFAVWATIAAYTALVLVVGALLGVHLAPLFFAPVGCL